MYAALFNLKDEDANVSVSLAEIASALPVKVGEKLMEKAASGEIALKELWTKEEVYCTGGAVYSPVETRDLV